MEKQAKNYFKLFAGVVLCLLVRLIPFRAPNIEPVFASTMPFSKAYGAWAGFSFAVSSVLLYDFVTKTAGMQTFFTVFAYGLIGLWSAWYFKSREANILNFAKFAIMGTLVYDALTGLSVGPIFFHQSFLSSLSGQIPFTLLHLSGNLIFALTLSPAIYHFLGKEKKEVVSFINVPSTI